MMKLPQLTLILSLAIWAGFCQSGLSQAADDPAAKRLNELLKQSKDLGASLSPDSVRELIKLGKEQGRIYDVSQAVTTYLRSEVRPALDIQAEGARYAMLAGDYRTAVARYKSYLESAPDNAQSAEAAAAVYGVLVEVLQDYNDAYQVMSTHATKFRSSPNVRRFDGWFLAQAVKRNDAQRYAQRLALVMADKLPLEQERVLYWDDLDRVMLSAANGDQEYYRALPYFKQILPLVREDRQRALRYQLAYINLAFAFGRQRQTAADLRKEYPVVLEAASKLVNAYPTGDNLRFALQVMAGGPAKNFDDIYWGEMSDLKQAFFTEVFPKLPADERKVILNWRHGSDYVTEQLATPEQWAAIGKALGAEFAGAEEAWRVPFNTKAKSQQAFKDQAAFLKGVPTPAAAVVESMASAADVNTAFAAMVANHSWYLSFGEPHQLLKEHMWPAFKSYAGNEKLDDNAYDKVMVAAGASTISKSPIAIFDTDAVADYVRAAFENSGKTADDKSQFGAHLKNLSWVPYTASQKAAILKPAQGAFRQWASGARRNKELAATIDKTMSQVEAAMKAFSDQKPDLSKAPDAFTRQLAELVVSQRGDDDAATAKLAREMYAKVSKYDEAKLAFGEATATYLVRSMQDDLVFTGEIIADQLAQYAPDKPSWRIRRIVESTIDGRSEFRGWSATKKAQKDAQALNETFSKSVSDMADKGIFWDYAFNRFRVTRHGSGWNNHALGLDTMEKLIEKKLLVADGYTLGSTTASGTCSYQWLIEKEFRTLWKKYPLESYFDTMFVEEAKKTGRLDQYYFTRGRDSKKLIATCAAELITAMDGLPFAYGDYQGIAYDTKEFWRWQDHAMNAPDGPRQAMLAKVESLWGKTRWDSWAMGRGYFRTEAAVNTPAARAEYFAKLKEYAARTKLQAGSSHPPRMGLLRSLGGYEKLTPDETNILVSVLTNCEPHAYWRGWDFEQLPLATYRALAAQDRFAEIYPLIPKYWMIVRDVADDRDKRAVAELANLMMEKEQAGLAAIHGLAGTQVLGNKIPSDVKDFLLSVRSKALSRIGGAVAVARTDPRYSIYQSQADYMAGNLESAWQRYVENSRQLLPMLKELDTQYTIWLINRHIDMREFDDANGLARMMIQWMDTSPVSFDKETRARILLTYADISFAMEEYPRARAQYERIAAAKEFDDTRSLLDANLKIAEVDRLTKQYDAAIERLDQLVRMKNHYVTVQANYQRALIKFDQEEYQASKEALQEVFLRDPNYYEARILEGQVNLKMKRLVEATQLRVTPPTSQRTIVPGKPMVVSLEDQNLSIAGKTRAIEIHAVTTGGDSETFSLLPFGESKTMFQGQIMTELGAAKKDDKVLQLLGNDEVSYNFSERFCKAHGIAGSEASVMSVAAAAQLYISSGEILTKEQIEEQQLEMMIKRQLKLEGATDKADGLRNRRRNDQIKPGNPVYVRLIDSDLSTTAEVDKVSVRVETSSGDLIPRFELTETEPASGVFEGRLPTGSAQATAYASDSKEGIDPNFVISGEQYPSWVALPDNRRPKMFSVDLNDNVPLKNLEMTSKEAGRRITSMIVQTSLNAREFETVGIWPGTLQSWDGSLQVEVVKFAGKTRPKSYNDFLDYTQADWYINKLNKVILPLKSLSVEPGDGVFGKANDAGIGRNDGYVLHVKGAFVVDKRQVRIFRLDTKERSSGISYVFAVDGKPAESGFEIKRSLGPGLHHLDVYAYVSRRNLNPTFDVLCDTNEPPYMAVCPTEMFDTTANPQIKELMPSKVAAIKSSGDLSTINITFSEGTDARLLRFILVDFETDAPAISKIKLFSTDTKKGENGMILPTKEDFRQLKENDTLEIVPGDRVRVTYTDAKPQVPTEDKHEGFLTATFSDATLQACFIDYRMNNYGVREKEYIPVRRFTVGDKVNIYVDEPDGDVSGKLDEVTFEVKSPKLKEPITLRALETEEHSGIFIGTIYPVKGESTKPTEIPVGENEEITVSFFDRENTDPGIPWMRTIKIEQAVYDAPQVRVFHATSHSAEEETRQATRKDPTQADKSSLDDYIEPRRSMVLTRPIHPDEVAEPAVFVDGPLIVEVLFPTMALTADSEAELFIQTSRARDAAGIEDASVFDVNLPGTIKQTVTPSDVRELQPPQGYKNLVVRGDPKAREALDDGRFTFVVPMEMGPLPDISQVDWKAESIEDEMNRPKLQIQGDDTIFIGFKYMDNAGAEQWHVQPIKLKSDVYYDVMDRKFQENLTQAYVGETVYLRVINKVKDVSDSKDELTVQVTTGSGQSKELTLAETFGHTGSFKGLLKLAYSEDKEEAERPGVLPVTYGDTITLIYKSDAGEELGTASINVFKGADGDVLPFTKRFRSSEISVQTQFMTAEAFFELAKKHHTLGQTELAAKEMQQAKRLLDEAIRTNPQVGVQAQAEYLLANLSYEYADIATRPDDKEKQFLESIARFNNIVASFPDSPYAPKAQYKKGLVFEKMGKIDQACEEYVKLSYRYPDNELVAETIARLGQYFLTKGKEMKDKADAVDDPVEKEKFRRQYTDTFKTAAEVFGRLSERFPDHNLAGKTIMLSAQCYMRAEDLPRAIEVYVRVADNPEEDKDLRSESMYWAGHCNMDLKKYEDAYKLFKKLTWDYPESKWAKYARGRLTDPNLNKLQMD